MPCNTDLAAIGGAGYSSCNKMVFNPFYQENSIIGRRRNANEKNHDPNDGLAGKREKYILPGNSWRYICLCEFRYPEDPTSGKAVDPRVCGAGEKLHSRQYQSYTQMVSAFLRLNTERSEKK